ncbi:leucine-rich repeat and calponin homology domain-containing protein 4-like [Polypterus senegalus]|uniref:leucine-rich repeat and calponin homology domain-containing protein 4-like n=1 Tax=Polypterus senegalus TaxID=55291 RepID=UPI001966446D|nr:leucine-rich repeat and calponin homology domain-containing protein 4-like [Polypterus senegalus]
MAAGEDSPLPAGIAGSRSVEKALEEAVASGALNLSNRKLKEFPRTARNYDLSDVTQADLSKNRLSELPEEVCQFISLESLSLYHNCARSIPEAVCNLQALTYINISRNQLSSLPPFLCQLPLKVLNASNNKLSTLPNNIDTLVNLRQLLTPVGLLSWKRPDSCSHLHLTPVLPALFGFSRDILIWPYIIPYTVSCSLDVGKVNPIPCSYTKGQWDTFWSTIAFTPLQEPEHPATSPQPRFLAPMIVP